MKLADFYSQILNNECTELIDVNAENDVVNVENDVANNEDDVVNAEDDVANDEDDVVNCVVNPRTPGGLISAPPSSFFVVTREVVKISSQNLAYLFLKPFYILHKKFRC